ncbi:ABC transporter ATP-binding protein [Paucilactobacillus wasatchensis]|uniref:Duplicated ATPase component of energizing module of thiamin-regulated ECF transporter for HydroxyMethylPyrimidine n=1 Tax=Paucilactobacillus wasatchensis TaxID=1335616 RepID=A0A0D1A710_9LACO|nr:ABC transporter ATP-binding protein [Paucilactobacillus wasatchensis]KIS03650.1 Duplicated ATPase component of energizing module of thiamin-regulated ECF transporter for HydroxyMethylPyrimidine [Paucilactobacillus wasatchensis]
MQSLNVNNLTFEYKEHSSIFQNVNIAFPLHRFNLLVGPSGSGKSTLLKIIAGLYPQFGGQLITGDVTITDVNLTTKKHQVAMLFQNPNQQFTMNTPRNELIFVLENLQVDPTQMDAKIDAALAFVDCAELANRNFNTLSGGEKQKVALAVIVAMDSPVILLDEPFASVDPTAREYLLTKLTKLRDEHHKTIILAEHDLHGYQSIADQVFQINPGANNIVPLEQTARENLFNQFKSTSSTATISLPADIDEPVISLINVELKQQDKPLLKQAEFSFFKDKITLITGENGIGKSTLFNAIIKLMPYQGQITLNDRDIKSIKQKKLARQVGLVFQDAEDQFLSITVTEEIELSKKHRITNYFTDQLIAESLANLNLAKHLDQVVYSLSDGQKKKLQILLMLISGQPILLLDEPLKGLDISSLATVLALIKKSSQKQHQSIIMISHQLTKLAGWVDYHVSFEHQRLTYQEVL